MATSFKCGTGVCGYVYLKFKLLIDSLCLFGMCVRPYWLARLLAKPTSSSSVVDELQRLRLWKEERRRLVAQTTVLFGEKKCTFIELDME
ncbi:hypothetical protein ACTXT7_013238 [Hymenolepis weldensis]